MPSGAAGLLPSGAAPSRTRRIKKTGERCGGCLLPLLCSARRRRSLHFSARAVHTRAKSRLSQRHPRGSWQCVTAEAHPLPFKHQDNTLFRRLLALPSPAQPRRAAPSAAGTPCRLAQATDRKIKQTKRRCGSLAPHASRPLFWRTAAVFVFKRGRYMGESCGFCGRTCAPPTYSDWTAALGVRGSGWELYSQPRPRLLSKAIGRAGLQLP